MISRMFRLAVPSITASYFGLVLALAAFTDFRLGGPVWAGMCATMVLLSLAVLLSEFAGLRMRRVALSSARGRQPV